MQNAFILVVDPDLADRNAAVVQLRDLGHQVVEAPSAAFARTFLSTNSTDLVVLENELPDSSGVAFSREIKSIASAGPTRILLTFSAGLDQESSAVLDSGADDFMAKPLSAAEFRTRVSACLRRPPVVGPDAPQLLQGAIRLHEGSHRVLLNGQPLELAPREYRLLYFFMNHHDHVYSRQQLLAQVWDQNPTLGERTVDVHVRRLRRVLEPFNCADYIQTVRGFGYRFSVTDAGKDVLPVSKRNVTCS